MQIYFLSAEPEINEAKELESRLRSKWRTIQKRASLDAIRDQTKAGNEGADRTFIVVPLLQDFTSFDTIIDAADRLESEYFLIFVSREITASDYKRLVRSQRADWAALKDAPEEIEEIILRNLPGSSPSTAAGSIRRPVLVAFIPSAGGVGNATLALETAIQLKLDKKTRSRRICLVDLEMQTSHICDYLDIEPRLRMNEIVDEPERLDKQLFDLFVSHHSSGVDVIASPRKRATEVALHMDALDALFGMIAASYDTLILDLPASWYSWTPSIISASNLVIVTGLNTVPGLRQVASTLASVKSVSPACNEVVIALNRCEPRLLGGIARGGHINKMLGGEQVVTVREDSKAATDSANTGLPIAIGQPSSRITKDIQVLAELIAKAGPKGQ